MNSGHLTGCVNFQIHFRLLPEMQDFAVFKAM
jgi:hypothetical protein